jgi:pimeloyl-ACP methyl ester carboxylesterase
MRAPFALSLTLLACGGTVTTAVTDAPRGDDRPATTDAPTPFDAGPAVTDVAAVTDVPAAMDVPAVTDVPAAMDVPAVTDVPAVPDVPAVTDVLTPREDVPAPAGPDYRNDGPLPTQVVMGSLVAAPSTGCTGGLCNVSIAVTLPTRGAEGRMAPWPLAVFSAGFSTASSAYAATATRLASWGYVVVRYDLQGESFLSAATHSALANVHGALVDWARAQGEAGMLRGQVDATRVFAAGHSRGGKVAALAATRDPRIVGVVGLDPVDSPPPFQSPSESFPLASAALRALTREVPMVVIGAEFGGRSPFGMPCAPTQYNYATFFDAARGPGLEVVLREAGHGQFVDDDRAAAASAALCPVGTAMNETVRSVSRALLVAWAERTVRGADVSAWVQGAWFQSRVADRTFASARRR